MEPNEGVQQRRTGARRAMLRLAALAATLLLAAALTGYVLRDRTWWLAVLMYLPMVLVAPAVIAVQLVAFERGRWKRRVAVMGVAAVAGAAAFSSMRGGGGGGGGGRTAASAEGAVRVIQWNVQWGRDEAGWGETVNQIAKAGPDVVVLSEAPDDGKIAAMCARLGPAWSFRSARSGSRSRYGFVLAVASRWPLSDARPVALPNGAAVAVEVDAGPAGPTRLLVVDGRSDPLLSRTPMLAALAQHCERESPDLVAGDFNAVSRSVGFDRIEDLGYDLASRSCDGWRGTYTSSLPLYDIDHIWVGGRYSVAACVVLHSPGTNHRGQLAYLRPSH